MKYIKDYNILGNIFYQVKVFFINNKLLTYFIYSNYYYYKNYLNKTYYIIKFNLLEKK